RAGHAYAGADAITHGDEKEFAMDTGDAQQMVLFETVRQAFLEAPDGATLIELVEQYPFMLEPSFLLTVEEWASSAEQEGDAEMAAALRERLEVLQELASPDLPDVRAALEAFAISQTPEDLQQLLDDYPVAAESSFHDLVAQLIAHAEQAGEHDDGQALRMRLNDLRQLAGAGPTLAALDGALEVLAALPNQQALLDLVAQAPFVLEETFLARVEERLEEAQQSGDDDLAGRLRARLEGLRLVQSNVQITLPQTLDAFAAVRDTGELLELAQRAPFILEERFADAVELAIRELEQAEAVDEAGALRMRLEAVRELAAQRSAADQSPLMQALIAFLNAHDEAAARRVFETYHDTLDSQDAQNTVEQAFAGGNAESQQRIDERARLLRSLRSPSS
ncbi:MAG TPA: hypothetical protein VFT99_14200, partial [Roseiflexaceae bacterium]|nr:hypothetical protein [Roseiflexaceae bacterium]